MCIYLRMPVRPHLMWQSLTAGCPCCLMSIWAKEQVSPTPTTSTVKFLKKSMISRDFLLRQKIKMMGVTTGLSSSSRINTWKKTGGKGHCTLGELSRVQQAHQRYSGPRIHRLKHVI